MGSKGGELSLVTVTNTLELGVNDPNVSSVVHVGTQRRSEDFVQVRRQMSESVVVVRRFWLK